MRIFFKTFIQGFTMGVAEIIPGISGGTVALILGIYEKLVTSISKFDLSLFNKIKNRNYKDAMEHIDLGFLLVLGFGMICAVLLFSAIISILISSYAVFFKSLLSGLLFSSLFLTALKPDVLDKNILFGVLGASAVGFVLIGLPSLVMDSASPLYIFLSGFIAICALVLPGISGSFILLLLGVYPIVISAVNKLDLSILITFCLGCFFGLFSSARIIKVFYEKNRQFMTAFFLGLILFSIPLIWKEDAFLINLPLLSESSSSVAFGLIAGALLILLLEKTKS
jgi:putative membrane protein